MKNFIKDYLKVIAFTLTGLVFVFASFYLMMNYNHSEEIKKTIYVSSTDAKYQEGQELLNKIENNLSSFNNKNNTNLLLMYDSLRNCYTVMKSEGTFFRLQPNRYYTATDIYNLGTKFQTKMINSCYVLNLSYLRTDDVPSEFKDISPFITSYVDSINNNVKDSLSEIENNSSYFYSTNIASSTIRNYLVSDYNTITDAYIDFAKIILNLSKNINNASEGGLE